MKAGIAVAVHILLIAAMGLGVYAIDNMAFRLYFYAVGVLNGCALWQYILLYQYRKE